MPQCISKALMMVLALVLCVTAWAQTPQAVAPAAAQPSAAVLTSFKVQHLMGFGDAHRNASGTLSAKAGVLRFEAKKTPAEIPTASIQDVVTDEDSKRLVRGALQALSMFAPYGGGRFLSLFREKVDVITVEYRDANGGLHGSIFQLPRKQASILKQQLIEQGAHTTVAPEPPAAPEKSQPAPKSAPGGGAE